LNGNNDKCWATRIKEQEMRSALFFRTLVEQLKDKED